MISLVDRKKEKELLSFVGLKGAGMNNVALLSYLTDQPSLAQLISPLRDSSPRILGQNPVYISLMEISQKHLEDAKCHLQVTTVWALLCWLY